MSYRDLIEVSVDFGNLEERLGEIDTQISQIEGLDEDKVTSLIDDAIENIDRFVLTDDFDPDEFIKAVDLEDVEERLTRLEGHQAQDGSLEAFETRLVAVEGHLAQAEERIESQGQQLTDLYQRLDEANKAGAAFTLLRQALQALLGR